MVMAVVRLGCPVLCLVPFNQLGHGLELQHGADTGALTVRDGLWEVGVGDVVIA